MRGNRWAYCKEVPPLERLHWYIVLMAVSAVCCYIMARWRGLQGVDLYIWPIFGLILPFISIMIGSICVMLFIEERETTGQQGRDSLEP